MKKYCMIIGSTLLIGIFASCADVSKFAGESQDRDRVGDSKNVIDLADPQPIVADSQLDQPIADSNTNEENDAPAAPIDGGKSADVEPKPDVETDPVPTSTGDGSETNDANEVVEDDSNTPAPSTEPPPPNNGMLVEWPCGQVSTNNSVDKKLLDVTLSGNICFSPTEKNDDVMFIIDVSVSMLYKDKYYDGNDDLITFNEYALDGNYVGDYDTAKITSCGRMKAMEKILENLKDSQSTRVAHITFDSGIKSQSSFTSVANFKATQMVAANLCFQSGATYYDVALSKAKEIFAAESATNKSNLGVVYFVTDGEPSTPSNAGKSEAAELREYATIITLMLTDADDTVLRQDIASRDEADNPMHFSVADAGLMVDLFTNLADSTFSKLVFRFKLSESGSWMSRDITHAVDGNNGSFTFKLGDTELETTPKFFETELIVTDSMGIERKRRHSISF